MRLRTFLLVLWAGLWLMPFGAAAQQRPSADVNTYSVTVEVKDESDAERQRAFRDGADALITQLARDTSAGEWEKRKAMIEGASALVASQNYDTSAQGSGKILRIKFDAAKFDEAMRNAGVKKWQEGGRGVILLWIGLHDGKKHTIVTSDDPAQAKIREIIQKAAERNHVFIVLPPKAQKSVRFTRKGWDMDEGKIFTSDVEKYGAKNSFEIVLRAKGKNRWHLEWAIGSPEASGENKKKQSMEEAMDKALGQLDWALMMHPNY